MHGKDEHCCPEYNGPQMEMLDEEMQEDDGKMFSGQNDHDQRLNTEI